MEQQSRFPTLSTNRLGAPRSVTHPKLGFLGTIQKAGEHGWYASDFIGLALGWFRTAREAREAIETAHRERVSA